MFVFIWDQCSSLLMQFTCVRRVLSWISRFTTTQAKHIRRIKSFCRFFLYQWSISLNWFGLFGSFRKTHISLLIAFYSCQNLLTGIQPNLKHLCYSSLCLFAVCSRFHCFTQSMSLDLWVMFYSHTPQNIEAAVVRFYLRFVIAWNELNLYTHCLILSNWLLLNFFYYTIFLL